MTPKPRRQYGSGGIVRRHTDACPPVPKGAKQRPDHKCNGLYVGRFYHGWTPNGTRRRYEVTAKTEAEVKRKMRDLRRKLESGEMVGPPSHNRITVKAWAEQWLEMRRFQVRPKTYATDSSMVRRWIVPTIGHRRVPDLLPSDVRAVALAVRNAGKSTTTARYAQGVLTTMLKAAQAEMIPVPAPLLTLKAPGKAAHDRQAMSLEDAVAILGAAASRPDASRWAAALLQGMRQGECLGLTWQAVDLDRGHLDISWQLQALPYLDRRAGTFRIPDGYEAVHLHGAHHLVRPKSKAGFRVIPLSEFMWTALRQWQHEAPANDWGLVWPALRPDRRNVVRPLPQLSRDDRDAWYALQDEAGVRHPSGRHYVLHEARHTTATLLLEAGEDVATIQAILGHSAAITTRGYQHASPALTRGAMQRIAEMLSQPRAIG